MRDISKFCVPGHKIQKGLGAWQAQLAPYHFCLLLTNTNKHAKAFYNRTLNKKNHISMSRTDAWYKTEEIAPPATIYSSKTTTI